MLTEDQKEGIKREMKYRTSRSGGKGGQNVNKVESKVEIEWDVYSSTFLNSEEKVRLFARIKELREGGILRMVSEKYRSQLENKEDACKKLFALVNKTLQPIKFRRATRPTYSSKRKKAEGKKKLSEKKQNRKKWKDE